MVNYPTIQLGVVIRYAKYELSVLYCCGDIFEKKCGEKDKKDINKEEQTEECQSSIPRCNKSL